MGSLCLGLITPLTPRSGERSPLSLSTARAGVVWPKMCEFCSLPGAAEWECVHRGQARASKSQLCLKCAREQEGVCWRCWLASSCCAPVNLCFVSDPMHLTLVVSPLTLYCGGSPGSSCLVLSMLPLPFLATTRAHGLGDGARPQTPLPWQVETYILPKLQRM